jgi:Ca-activated chloride channel family protein
MSFHSPHFLWLLVPLILLFSWELARHSAAASTVWPKIARAWAGAFDVSLGARHTTAENRPRIWLWFGFAFCVVALARPQWGVIEEQVFDQSREVLLAVDLSKSMQTQDVKPSRLERSKLLITALLDGLKGERVGLVVFSGTAFLESPLSSDYEILREFLPSLNPDYLPEGGTNYKSLLEAAIQAFGTSTADRYLIILSDGEATDDEWKPLVDSLKEKGIRVIGLGVGSAQGGFIPDGSGGFVKDERGAVVLSRLESATLQELAQATGGAYADASGWVDLPGLLRQTVEAGQKGQFTEKNTARLIERFQWFLAPGLLLLLFSFWAEFPVRPRERALPLGTGKRFAGRAATAAAPVASVLLLIALCHPSALRADDVMVKPLSNVVARLAGQDALSVHDEVELAETTITYGQRAKGAQQVPVEGAIRDALTAVDQGEKADPKATDWPKLRQQLEELLKKSEPPKPPEQQKKDQQKQDQQQNQQNQNPDQSQQNKDNKQSESKDQQKNQQQQQQEQQKKQNQDAFGDMKDQKQDQAKKPEQTHPQPTSGTQKIGGQKEKPAESGMDPAMTLMLQKLEQVKNQDSPVKLQMLMQPPSDKPAKTGKDW